MGDPEFSLARLPPAWMKIRIALALLPLLSLALPADGRGQVDAPWNTPEVLELVERARAVRWSNAVDTAFRSYQAEAQGYVYFFIDRPDTEERTLIKADQIALEVFWQAPNLTRQRIVGLRDRKVLPTNIRYHLDHLTVVQDDFGDFIRLGDGDEVEEVLHPLGPASERTYDFRLTDSLTLSYGGPSGTQTVRVYEVQVRPRDFDRPGFIGSVYLDRDLAAVVRMSFTFTPASYVDPYLDYIRISLDNALWLGRYWLPYRQEAELRRELPALDFLAGSIIRGRFEIGGYDFNVPLNPQTFAGRRVTAVPRAQRETFPFERGLFDDLEEEGLTPAPALEDIRARALEMAGTRYLTGLAPVRLHVPSASHALRYNRAEGTYLGAGTQLRPSGPAVVRLAAGYAFAAARASATVGLTTEEGSIVPDVRAYRSDLRDLGGGAGTSGVLNTLATAIGIGDYLDPYYATGLALTLTGRDAAAPLGVRLTFEKHSRARMVIGEGDERAEAADAAPTSGGSRSHSTPAPGGTHRLRPTPAVPEGLFGTAEAWLATELPGAGEGRVRSLLGRFEDRTFVGWDIHARWLRARSETGWSAALEVSGGMISGGAPAQALTYLGGRGTLPGYGYRAFTGSRWGLLRAEGSHPLLRPWVGLRVFTTVGFTHLPTPHAPPGWQAQDSDGLRPSVGMGLSLGWDVLRLDLARGLRGGRWTLDFSVDPRFRAWL